MKKFVILIASTKLLAAPVGNTSAPDIINKGFFTTCNNNLNVRVGYEGDFVADGKMKQNQGTGHVDNYEQWTNSAVLTLNLLERMDIYGVFGSSKTKANWRFENYAAHTIHRIKLDTQTNFLWAIGSRVILCQWCSASLGCGGRYSFCDYQPTMLTSNGISSGVSGAQCQWQEWQINLDLSYKIHFFTPYIGVKYDKAHTELNHFETPISSTLAGSNSFENCHKVGVYVGCAISNGRYFMLNLEGRLVDEEAITVSGDFRF